MKRALFAACILCLIPLSGCGDEEPSPAPVSGCAEGNQIGDVCAGVPAGKLCSGSGCATAEYCTSVEVVTNDSELQSAVSGAADGTCIVMSPGSYSAVTLPPVRMQLVAEHPDDTTLSSVTSTGGDDVRMGGFNTASVTFEGGTGTIEYTRIANSPTDGVNVGVGARLTVRGTEIVGAARYGVSAFDAGHISLESSVVRGNDGPGIWIQSGDSTSCVACDCVSTVTGAMSDTIIQDNAIVGVSIVRALDVSINNVEVRDTTVGSNFEAGGGVSVAYCSTVNAENLSVYNSADFGLLVHDAAMNLEGGRIESNLRGMWLQNIGTSMTSAVFIKNVTAEKNQGVGIGIAEGSTAVAINNSSILSTLKVSLPVLVNNVSAGSEEVGDGMNWLAGSQAVLDGVTIGGSERQSVLIDGEVGSGSVITDLQLVDGDQDFGVLQQNLPADGEQPATSGTSPTIMTSQSADYETPLPLVPPGI